MAPKKSATGGKKKGAVGKKPAFKMPEYGLYIHKIMKQKAPDAGITNAGVTLINEYLGILTDRLIEQTGRISRYDKKETAKQKHAQTATNMLLVGPLAYHADGYASEAIEKFKAVA